MSDAFAYNNVVFPETKFTPFRLRRDESHASQIFFFSEHWTKEMKPFHILLLVWSLTADGWEVKRANDEVEYDMVWHPGGYDMPDSSVMIEWANKIEEYYAEEKAS